MPCCVNPYSHGGGFPANAVTFDGTNDYLLGAASSPYFADSKMFSASFWFRSTNPAKLCLPFYTSVGGKFVQIEVNSPSGTGTDGAMHVLAYSPSGVQTLSFVANVGAGIHDGNWHHFAFSLDMSAPSNRTAKVDGGDFSGITWQVFVNQNIGFTAARTVMSVGDNSFATGSVNRFQGDLAEVYIAPGKNLRFDQMANLRKFISASGKPVQRAANGGFNGADIPDVWLSGETATWHQNKGNAGGFTLNGALTTSTNLPVEL